MTLPKVLLTYLGALTIPGIAGPAHDVNWITSFQPIVLVDIAALIVLAAIACVRMLRSPNRRIYLFCAIWIALTIAPALNLNSLWWLVDDRYLYAPSFGWSLAFAVAALEVAASSATVRNAVGIALAALLALYIGSTIQSDHYWHDEVTFFTRSVEIAPRFADYRYKLAYALNETGQKEHAARVLERGVELDPNDAHMHLRLAQQYQAMGRELDFIREFQKFSELSGKLGARELSAGATQSP